MIRIGKQSISFLRLGVTLFSLALLIFLVHTFASAVVKNRLHEFDESYTIDGIEYGFNSIIVRNLQMPGRGISSRTTSVLIGGDVFHPVPLCVVLQGVVIRQDSSSDYTDSVVESDDLPVISVIDGRISPYDIEFYGTRAGGIDTGHASGQWGEIFVNRSDDSIFVVFNHCSSIPGMEDVVPDIVRGHSISGSCSGIIDSRLFISGSINELDGESVSADFEYRILEGKPSASFSMDFSQVADPAMALLDSLSSGAVMTEAPSGSISVSFSGNDTVFFSTDLQFDSLSIWSTSVAPDTFSFETSLFCRGFALRESDLLVIDSGTIHSGEMDLAFGLMYSWGARRRLNLVLSNRALTGEAITRSVPPELLGSLSGLELGGELSIFSELELDWDYPDSCDINLEIDASRLTVGYSPVTF